MDMDGMDMGDTGSTGETMVMMKPWMHFTGGDNLFFESWAPSSSGAIVGACIGLVFVAIFERWISAIRGVLEAHWRRRGLALAASAQSSRSLASEEKCCGDEDRQTDGSDKVVPVLNAQTVIRTIPPFILSHDIPRGFLHAFQVLLGYVLMLAVMTFQAAYLISIVVGLGIGEILFGRIGDIH